MTLSASAAADSTMDMPSSRVFSALLQGLRRRYRRRRVLKEARAAFMHTVHLDDRMLDDLGVTREEVLWAASLPLEVNAALALQARAAARRAAEASAGARR